MTADPLEQQAAALARWAVSGYPGQALITSRILDALRRVRQEALAETGTRQYEVLDPAQHMRVVGQATVRKVIE